MFFHLPFLIAHYLNSSQKFADADSWYRRIFDPTATEHPEPSNRTDRNWRYIEFRNRNVPRLREILTDEDAIERYKEDPFNPFAIARLRTVAFQKAVVMKYVDNLLDWGDQLFAQDTYESVNEATMLYVMAADILGDRPLEVGDCETATEFLLTYGNIHSHQQAGSEFLIELENLYPALAYLNVDALKFLNSVAGDGDGGAVSTGFAALRAAAPRVKSYTQITAATKGESLAGAAFASKFKAASISSANTASHRGLAFCVPPNETLLGYWDRVEDRLYKIRHCMNLQGVRRQLALFQPPIDPGLLVKAKASGLSLEDVLQLLTAEMPAYRFAYLIEKAKQFAGTVQSFGNSLLSALEKKDAEQLTLLRAVHEQELLKAVRKVKEDAITEATHNKSSLEQNKALAAKRKEYYAGLVDNAVDPALAISKNEKDSLDKQEDAKSNENKASKREQGASGVLAAPLIGFDMHPFDIGIPFNPFGEVPLKAKIGTVSISYSTQNVASALSASSSKFRRDSSFKNIESNRAATRGGYERRKQEWQHQRALAELEGTQVDKQILAADVRIQLAQKDLAAHQKQIEQAEELHEFYKDKFTNLGLYTYLAASLSRLYREAYNLAHDVAMKAQRAYQFETDDQTFFIGNDNWQADKAGLLAGERLTLQLQRMEKAYLEQNRREYEITLPCSVAQINPQALLELRSVGSCDFTIPEAWFDLYYPGQYKRTVKSVRLTIPCVTGPYTNVSAKMTLTGSRIRTEPRSGDDRVRDITAQRNTSVATSTANNDAGVFELTFRDERYLPFEGAGAVSDWHLELPSVFRPFDYETITDVIVHVSYTARDDGRFKEEVEAELADRLTELAADEGLVRLFSLRHEFSTGWHRFLHPPANAAGDQTITMPLAEDRFPFLFRNRAIMISEIDLFVRVEPEFAATHNESTLVLSLQPGTASSNDPLPLSQWNGLLRATSSVSGSPGEWTLTAFLDTGGGTHERLNPNAITDIFALCHYTLE